MGGLPSTRSDACECVIWQVRMALRCSNGLTPLRSGATCVFAGLHSVLRAGGDLVISDLPHERVTRGSVITARGPSPRPGSATGGTGRGR